MSRTYKNVWHRPVADIAAGKMGELDLTAQEEAQLLEWGRLEVVPVEYEVVGPRRVAGCEPGERFTAGYPQPIEAMLIQAGHIEPVKKPSKAASDKGD